MGRPVGYPKSGGRRKGPESKVGKEGREWLAKNSKVLDLLARVAAGRPVRVANKARHKPKWHYPTFADQKWACEQLLPRLIPTLSSAEAAVDVSTTIHRIESVIIDANPQNPDS